MLKDQSNSTKYPVISECPVCHHELTVTTLHCDHCHTGIEGKFTLSKFNYLDTEKLYFIEVFVKNRGNIKSIEKEMNLSYPTIKKMLDEVIVGLGYNLDTTVTAEETDTEDKPEKPEKPRDNFRLDILEKLNNGELEVEKAMELLKKLKKGGI